MSAGLRYVAMSPNILSVMLRGFAFGFGGIVVLALLPLIARDLVKGGPLTFGILLGAFGVGALVGAALSARLRRTLTTEALVRATFATFALAAAVAAVSPWIALTMLPLCAAGACWVLTLVDLQRDRAALRAALGGRARDRALPDGDLRRHGGRQLALGLAALHLGTEQALLAAACTLLVGAALGFRSPLPPMAALDLDPLSRWREPQVAVDIEPRSGPIIVTVEYLIRDEDVIRFPRRDGRAPAHPPPRRRAPMDPAARPGQPRALDRALRKPDLGGICPAEPAHHQGRCRDRRPHPRAAPRRRAAARAPPDRAPGQRAAAAQGES